VDADLNRADIVRSICTFIMCDKTQTERSFDEDKTNIMRAINIKKFVSAMTAGAEAKLVIQLLQLAYIHTSIHTYKLVIQQLDSALYRQTRTHHAHNHAALAGCGVEVTESSTNRQDSLSHMPS
jgi:hypothetical protein